MMETQNPPKKGKVVLMSLLAFFALFSSVDAFFVYKAVTTHSGVITEQAYEKGLAYNQALKQAREQKNMNVRVVYKGDTLVVNLNDELNMPIIGATVTAKLIRNVQAADDFDVLLHHSGDGVYSKQLDLPLKGLWTANIEAKWTQKNTKYYQTALTINNQ
jgi:nitrogen fixation protein FixH